MAVIYCIEYAMCNPQGSTYLYVGSHHCDPRLDGYVGSSPGPWHDWPIKSIHICCSDTAFLDPDHPLRVETTFIETYARIFGVAQYVAVLKRNNVFVRSYVCSNGRLLNQHSNCCECLNAPEARAKAVATRRAAGSFSADPLNTPEARAKASATRKMNGQSTKQKEANALFWKTRGSTVIQSNIVSGLYVRLGRKLQEWKDSDAGKKQRAISLSLANQARLSHACKWSLYSVTGEYLLTGTAGDIARYVGKDPSVVSKWCYGKKQHRWLSANYKVVRYEFE